MMFGIECSLRYQDWHDKANCNHKKAEIVPILSLITGENLNPKFDTCKEMRYGIHQICGEMAILWEKSNDENE